MIRHHHSLLQEGFDAGLLGGLTIALWFLLLDALAGHPLFTPSVLGQVVIFGQQSPNVNHLVPAAIAAYTAAHFVAFFLFGVMVTYLVHLSVRFPVVRFALLLLFATFEILFYGFINALSAEVGALFPLWSVLVANMLAAVVMGVYFWRKHPALRRALAREPLGA